MTFTVDIIGGFFLWLILLVGISWLAFGIYRFLVDKRIATNGESDANGLLKANELMIDHSLILAFG